MTTSFTIREIPLDSITTDGYQRERIDSHVERIAGGFDPAQWDLPKVTERPDGYRVIAGQHRVEAARVLAERGSWPFLTPVGVIQAQVVEGISDTKGEAVLFMADAKNKKSLSPYDKHRAALVAEERQAIEVQEALDTVGVPLVRRQRSKSGQSIVAVTALYRLWDRGHASGRPSGGVLVTETLRLACHWDANDIFRFDGLLLGGLGLVAQEHLNLTGKVTRLERFVKKVPAYTVATLAQKWSVEHGGVFSNTPMPYANVIRERL